MLEFIEPRQRDDGRTHAVSTQIPKVDQVLSRTGVEEEDQPPHRATPTWNFKIGTASVKRIADGFCIESHELLGADRQVPGIKDPLELGFEVWPSVVPAGILPKTSCYERSKSTFRSLRHYDFRRCPLDVLVVFLPHPAK